VLLSRGLRSVEYRNQQYTLGEVNFTRDEVIEIGAIRLVNEGQWL